MEPLQIKTGLDPDLLELFNNGQPTIALLAGIYRELKLLNGAKVIPAVTPPAETLQQVKATG
jgi:hypothetical protein